MKALLVLLVMTTSAFAQTNFLSVHEASRINKYMDEICPDTYCGGDISFYTQGITCNGDRCSIVITGSGKSDFDETSIESALRKKREDAFREYYFLAGSVFRWHMLYDKVPKSNSWVWQWFPDGKLWETASKVSGADALNAIAKQLSSESGMELHWVE